LSDDFIPPGQREQVKQNEQRHKECRNEGARKFAHDKCVRATANENAETALGMQYSQANGQKQIQQSKYIPRHKPVSSRSPFRRNCERHWNCHRRRQNITDACWQRESAWQPALRILNQEIKTYNSPNMRRSYESQIQPIGELSQRAAAPIRNDENDDWNQECQSERQRRMGHASLVTSSNTHDESEYEP